MPKTRLFAATLAFVMAGCAGISTGPSSEAKQALAPTGKLRVGLMVNNPTQGVRDDATGEVRGVGVDLGRELARRLDVPFVAVTYPSIGALLEKGKAGEWDVGFFGNNPARAVDYEFTAPHLEVEIGYLVPPSSALMTLADVDRTGVRLAVQDKSVPDVFFSRELKAAVLVRAASFDLAVDSVKSGKADVMGGIKPILFEVSNRLPGWRILDGRPGVDGQAMAMPKGRSAGTAYARRFIEDAKAEGLVKAAIERAGIRGAVQAAPQ